MKLYNKIIVMFVALALSLSACTEPDDMTETKIGGTLVSVEDASGKLLGLPNSDGSVTFMDVDLAFNAFVPPYYTQTDVDHFSVSKRLTQYSTVQVNHDGEMVDSIVATVSDWVEVETVSSLPYDLNYTTVDEFVSGLNIATGDLRIGDFFEFTTRIVTNSGDVYVPSSSYGVLTVTVNCLSDLEGAYDLTIVRDDGSTYVRDDEYITETAPGEYETVYTGGWSRGAYSATQGFDFTDVCGELTVPNQGLFQGMYSNEVYGEGAVDPATGNLNIVYTITFSSGNSVYTCTYVPKAGKGKVNNPIGDQAQVTSLGFLEEIK